MRRHTIWIGILTLALLLSGCWNQTLSQPDPEPTATYDWMDGESPVSNRRIGVVRAGVNLVDHAVSPTGIYINPQMFDGNTALSSSYIFYADHGSDSFRKLCGRADCIHDNEDCNAYLYQGSDLSYYRGKLYAVIGEGYPSEECKLVQMEPDGSQHRELLDLQAFAAENNADFSACDIINDGYCQIMLYGWVDNDSGGQDAEWLDAYYYKLDGSMKTPEPSDGIGIYYQCGDHWIDLVMENQDGEEYECYYGVDPETRTSTYLTQSPGIPGWFGEQEAYYFKDGAIIRLDYATQKEEVMVDTGLAEDYYAFCFPDCIVLASRERGEDTDDQLYFYNWAYELVDTVKLDYPYQCSTDLTVMAETAERIILTNGITDDVRPLYYIEKSELGTGNVQLYAYQYE